VKILEKFLRREELRCVAGTNTEFAVKGKGIKISASWTY
jgi:hypothetical protein